MANIITNSIPLFAVRRDGQLNTSSATLGSGSGLGGAGGGGLAGVWWSGGTLHIDGNLAALGDVAAFAAGYTGSVDWSSMPIASATVLGGIKIGAGLIISTDGCLCSTGSGSAGTWGSISGTLSSQTDLTTALGLKANVISPTFSGNVALPATTSIGSITPTELGYVHSTTSSIQTQLNGKLNTGSCAADSGLLGGYPPNHYQVSLTDPITGVGTVNYLSKFDGTFSLTNSIINDNGSTANVVGNLTVQGEVTAYAVSDLRLKTNINTFCAIEIINQIKPVTFHWNNLAKELNNTKNDKINYGIIAQDLEQVLPELVHPIYEDYKAIDYIQLIPILIQSVKELEIKIKNLEEYTELYKKFY
jgi:hypothetical protein